MFTGVNKIFHFETGIYKYGCFIQLAHIKIIELPLYEKEREFVSKSIQYNENLLGFAYMWDLKETIRKKMMKNTL